MKQKHDPDQEIYDKLGYQGFIYYYQEKNNGNYPPRELMKRLVKTSQSTLALRLWRPIEFCLQVIS